MRWRDRSAAPAHRDHSPSRHIHHKDTLMQRFDHDHHYPSASTPARSPFRLPGLALALPAVSAALVGALTLTFSLGDHSSAPVAGSAAFAPAQANSATIALGRIATAATERDAAPVKKDQFVYVQRLARENKGTYGDRVMLGALHKEEIWTAQKPGPTTLTGWIRSSGKDAVMPGQLVPCTSSNPVRPGLWYATYAWMASLPTDRAAMRELLYDQTEVEEGESKDEAVFRTIGDLLSSVTMPTATTSALYEAAALIPGITRIPDVVDAAGRHGMGITRRDDDSATRSVLIFDKHTLAYIGSQAYFVRGGAASRDAENDVLFGIDAVMERGIVEQPGETLAHTAG
ncbi:CU044_5270 family protein [Streptomyces sp. NBC_01341]|uniref:CU044_5270 family protein n=1 Tax=Streptomyces sp. NBC_01341 TaxID=2903831 RepID=UPI002E10EDBD|nr:CU044_5270 family protein [Streptomyces sp. NBC_01341]